MQSKEEEAKKEPKKKGKYRCPQCGKTFDSEKELKKHVEREHTEEDIDASGEQKTLTGGRYPTGVGPMATEPDNEQFLYPTTNTGRSELGWA